MDNALPLMQDGYALKFIFLPDGEDPDSLIRQQGKEAFEKIISQAMPLSEFLFEHLLANINMNSAEGKSAAIESFQPYLLKLPESHLKEAIINKLAHQFGYNNQQQFIITKSLQADRKPPLSLT